jgi:hypothetical protein
MRLAGSWQKQSSDPSRVTCLGKIGASYNGIRRWSEAQHWLKHALALDPRHVGAAYRLNLTYIASTGDIQRAKRAREEYRTTKQTWAKVRPSPMRS